MLARSVTKWNTVCDKNIGTLDKFFSTTRNTTEHMVLVEAKLSVANLDCFRTWVS